MSGRTMKGVPAVATALLLLAATFVAAVPALNPFLDGSDFESLQNEESGEGRDFDLGPYFSDPDGNEADPERIIELLRCTLVRTVPAYADEECVIDGEVVPVEAAPAVFPTTEQIRAELQAAICGGNSAIPPKEAFCDEDALSSPLSDLPVPSDLPPLPAPPSLVVPTDDHTVYDMIINLIEDAEHEPVNVFCEEVFPAIEDLANDDVFGGSPPPTGECREDDEGNWEYERPSTGDLTEWAPEPEIDPGDIDPSDHYATIDDLYNIIQATFIQATFVTLCGTLLNVWESHGHEDYKLYCTDEIAAPNGEPIDFQDREECRARDDAPENNGPCEDWREYTFDGYTPDEDLTILDRDGDGQSDAWRIQLVCTVYDYDRQWDENCQSDTHTEPVRHNCISSDFLWGGSDNHTGMLVTSESCVMRITGAVWVLDEETDRVHFEVYDGFDDRFIYSRLTFDAFNEDQEQVVLQILDKNDEGDEAISDRFLQFNEDFWPLANIVCNQLDPLDPDEEGGDAIGPTTLRTVYGMIGYEDRSCNVGWVAPTDFGWLVLSNPTDLDGDGTPNIEEINGVEDPQDPGGWTDWLDQVDPSDPRYDDVIGLTFRTSNPFNFMATPFNPRGDPCVVPEGELNPCVMPVNEVDVEFTQVQEGVGPLREDFPYTVWGTVELEYQVDPINALEEDPESGVEYSSWRIFETSEPVPIDPSKQTVLCGEAGSFRITDDIEFGCGGEEAWVFGNHDRVRYLFLELCAAPDPIYGKDHLPEICVKNIPHEAKPTELPPFDPPEAVLGGPEGWESRVPDEEELDSPGIIVHVWNQPAVQVREWIPHGFPANPPAHWPDGVKTGNSDSWGDACDRNVDTSSSQTDWHCGFAEIVVTAYHPGEDVDFLRSTLCLQAPDRADPPGNICINRDFDWPEIGRRGESPAHLLEDVSILESTGEGERLAGTMVFLHDTRDYPHARDKNDNRDDTLTQGSGIKITTEAEVGLLETKQSDKDWRPNGEGRGGHLCVSNSCWIRVFHNEPPVLQGILAEVLEAHEDDPVMDTVFPPGDDNPTDERVVAFEFDYEDDDRNSFSAPSEITIEIFDEDGDDLLHSFTDDDPISRDWPDSPCRRTGTEAPVWHQGEPMQCIWDFKDEDGELVDAATVKWQVTAVDRDGGENTFISDLLDLNIVPLPDVFNGLHETEPLPTYFGDHRVDFQVTYDGHNFAPGRDEGGNETVYVELERLDGAESETRVIQMERCRVQTDESDSKAVFCAERELFPDGSEWEYRFRGENERGREAYDPPLGDDPYELALETVCAVAGAGYCQGYDELLREQAQGLQDEVNAQFWGPIHTFNEQEIAAPWGTDVCLTGVDVCLYPDEDGDLLPDLVEEWLLQSEVVNTMNEPESEPVFQFYEDIRIAVCQPDTSSLPLPRECEFPLVEVTLSEEDGASTLSVCTDDGECHIEDVTVHVVDFQVTLLGFEIHAFAEDGEEVFFLLADGTRAGSGSSPILSFGAQTIDHSIHASVQSNPIDVCLEGTGGFSSLDDSCVYPGSVPPVGIQPQADGSFCLLRYPISGSGQPQEVCPLVLSADDIPEVPDVPDTDPEQETVNLVCGAFEPEGCEQGDDGNWTYTPTAPEVLDPTNPSEVFGAAGLNEELNCRPHTSWTSWLNQTVNDPECQYT